MTRYIFDEFTDSWLAQDEYRERYERASLYTALRGRKVPRGLTKTAQPDGYGKSKKFHDAVLHRLDYVISGTFEAEEIYAARYACGQQTVVLTTVAEPGTERRCRKCFGEKTWTVYGYWNAAGEALYIGQTVDLHTRRTAHRNHSSWHREVAWHDALSAHETEAAARTAERDAIRKYRPLHNVQHQPKEVAA